MSTYDLLLAGGDVLDPATGTKGRLDIGIAAGKIAAIGAGLDRTQARRVLPVDGLTITPGLIDLHCHGFWGASYWGIELDPVCLRSGVMTAVDAGSAGGYTLPAFRRWVIGHNRTRTLCYLNISSIGLTAATYELTNLNFADVDLAVTLADQHRDVVVGIKARIDTSTVGDNGVEPLRRARLAADQLGLPVMVHIGKGPPELGDILECMRPGDVLTHCHTGNSNRIIDDQGQMRHDARAAHQRGILLDVGHGQGSFSFDTAERLLDAGEWPDTISTDVHAWNVNGPVYDLPTTLSKYMLLGMPFEEVVKRSTSNVAAALGRSELGTLAVGSVADLAALAVEEGDFVLTDSMRQSRPARQRLVCRLAIRAGEVVYREAGAAESFRRGAEGRARAVAAT